MHKIPATTGLHSKDIFYSEWFKTASNFFFRGTSIFMLPPLENKAILINCFLAVQHVSVGAKIIHVFADTTFAPFSKKKLARLMIMSYFPFNFFLKNNDLLIYAKLYPVLELIVTGEQS